MTVGRRSVLLLGLLLLFATPAVEARRHRYGHLNKPKQPPPRRTAVMSASAARRLEAERLAAEEAAAAEEVEADEDVLVHDDEPSLEAVEGGLERKRRQSGDDWPPRWTQPVVIAGTIYYSSMFF